MAVDQAMRKQIEQEKQNISTELGDMKKFLAYTHDDGQDDVEQEPERHGIRKLKGTPVWAVLYPARKGYRAAKFLRQNGISGVTGKVQNAVENNRFQKRKEARKYLTKIMPTEEEKLRQRSRVFEKDIKISVLVPLYNTPEQFLRDMIQSVIEQTYRNWELCLADASDAAHGNVEEIVREYAKKDSRIIYQKLEKNFGISENTNYCIRMAKGTYLALFDHDDLLHPSALYECAKTIEETGAQFVYTDEVTFEGNSLENIITYHFKPDFSVDNLRGVNYICHLSVFQKQLIDKVGMFRKEYDGSQDHDMIMRLTDAAEIVWHIPKVLYFWRCHAQSTSMNLDSKSYAIAAGRNAVKDAELRRGYPAEVHSAQICKTHYRMNYEIANPKVSVIVDGSGQSGKSAAYTAAGVEKCSSYGAYELYYAAAQNEIQSILEQSDGEYVLILAAGILPLTPTFMEELLMFAQRGDVGMAGMQILDTKDMIYSSDIVIGNSSDTLALEVNRGQRYDAPGYMGRNYYAHNVSAISGLACMAKREELYKFWVKGKTKTTFARMLEICFRLRREEKQIVVNPYALCRLKDTGRQEMYSETDRQILMETYKEQMITGDPFYNKNLSLENYWRKK